jgi:hypothetical protein
VTLVLVAGALLLLGAVAVPLALRAVGDDDEVARVLALGTMVGVVGLVASALAAWLGLR